MIEPIRVLFFVFAFTAVGYSVNWVIRNYLLPKPVVTHDLRTFGQSGRSLSKISQEHKSDFYSIFTTEFDVEVDARMLWSELGVERQSLGSNWLEKHFDRTGQRIRAIDIDQLARRGLEDTLVTILIDHSGSIKGKVATEIASSVGVFCESLFRQGIVFELLGFTTRSWKGGESRLKWRRAGRPSFPGRLCDLLHIVYQSAIDDFADCRDDLLLMNQSSLLRENVDGEAILWAKSRFESSGLRNWICIVVSDGAPVDDSTLSANMRDGTCTLLVDHVKQVIRSVEDDSACTIVGLGIGYSVEQYYRFSHKTESLEKIQEAIGVVFGKAVSEKLAKST
jgi:cobaltochelatase CobT